MRQTAELENQMVSVERVEEYVNLPSEPPMETAPEHQPKGDWPSDGRVKFHNLSLKYSDDSEYVLKQLTFEIEPQAKIGIVGRTGKIVSNKIDSQLKHFLYTHQVLENQVSSKPFSALLQLKVSSKSMESTYKN